MKIEEAKSVLRAKLKKERAALDPSAAACWDKAIDQHIQNTDWFQKADILFSYVSVEREVDTLALLKAAWRCGKRVAVPRCTAPGRMDFFVVTGMEELIPGKYGIPEPRKNCPAAKPTELSLCLVPGLCFDRRGFRIGYGGGYYDRFLSAFPGKSLGLVRQQFLVDRLPTDRYDLPVDGVVTQHGWIKTN